MTKIAVLGAYPLDPTRLSGVEVAIVYVQRELLKQPDVTLHVISCHSSLTEPKTVQDGRLTVTYLPRGSHGRITWHRQEVAALRRVLDAFCPDMVHAHGSGLYAGAALGSGYPAVVTVHGIAAQEARLAYNDPATSWGDRLRGLLDSAYERWVIGRAEHLIVISPYVEQVFARVFRGTCYLVENACEERFFDLRREPVPGRLLFAGPVIPRKGVLLLLQALERVRREMPEAHVRIAGSLNADPDYARACQALVAERGMEEAVAFLGHVSQEQVLEEYRRCAVFVLPSFQETAPMVIEQAMAAGVPSVATRVGGVPWMLEDGVTGLTLPAPGANELRGERGQTRGGLSLASTVDELTRAILRLLQNPAQARSMGERARIEAEARFRPEAVARRTLGVYRSVLSTDPNRRFRMI
ncbi:MAG: glycosyltransferase family 4 protein [Chloroflexi bacterium]|nr:glycosyltransferase family 4 protein [Chloroflexota bacterium]